MYLKNKNQYYFGSSECQSIIGHWGGKNEGSALFIELSQEEHFIRAIIASSCRSEGYTPGNTKINIIRNHI